MREEPGEGSQTREKAESSLLHPVHATVERTSSRVAAVLVQPKVAELLLYRCAVTPEREKT